MNTEKDILHGKYLDICDRITIKGLEAYDVKKLLYNETFYVQDSKWTKVLIRLISNVMFNLNLKTQIRTERKNDELVLFSTGWNRRDYDEYWSKICNIFPENTRITIAEKKTNFKDMLKNISLVGMCRNIKSAIHIYRKLKEIKNKKHRIYLMDRLLKIKKVHDALNKMNIQPKVAMCFFDSGFYESLAMQFFKNVGAVTIANQHGQPVFKSYDYDRMNQSQMLNFKSDYFFAKGEFTKKQFIKAGFTEKQIVVIGSFNKVGEYQRQYEKKKLFCTFLNCIAIPNAKEMNDKLLKITAELSERLGYKFYIKLHPSDSIENYKAFRHENLVSIIEKGLLVSEIAEDIDFGLFNQSSILIDLLDYKTRAFRLDGGELFPIVEDEETLFEDIDGIEKNVKKWLEYSDVEKEKYFERTSVYYNGMGNAPQNIKRFIDGILEGN